MSDRSQVCPICAQPFSEIGRCVLTENASEAPCFEPFLTLTQRRAIAAAVRRAGLRYRVGWQPSARAIWDALPEWARR